MTEKKSGNEAYCFDAAAVRDAMVESLKDYAKKAGFTDVVLGISGGKDSTVSAAICARALGAEHVYGVMLPDSEQPDIADSRAVCEALGIRTKTVNIGKMHKELDAAVASGEGFSVPDSVESGYNVPPRLRMTVLRYIAQALGARLVGTGNLSEITVGYCTKDGDTSCDFSLLGGLTSVEVVEVGLTMEELPAKYVQKTPSDGLSGKSDEERLGITYREIHDYIRKGSSGSPEADEKIARKEMQNMHKREKPVVIYRL